jgi:ferritin-like metal-binding protein YciE
MPNKPEGLEKLLVEELQDLLDAEKQLVKALPRMAKSASDDELENALREHLEVTKGQVQRLERVFESMDMRPRSRPCKGMKGIVEEGQEIIGEDLEKGILDSALTGAARKVEHYEMMGYESARSLAQQLGRKDAAQLLQQTLQEETQADRQLAQISKRLLKETSSRRPMAAEEEPRGATRRGSKAASGARSASRGAKRGSSSSRRGGKAGASAQPLTDHEEIRTWAEERGAQPACVRGTGDPNDVGMIRLDFPGYSGEESLQPISWDEWFERFDERGLALIVQDKTAGGQTSNFNKLVSREAAGQRQKTRTAR